MGGRPPGQLPRVHLQAVGHPLRAQEAVGRVGAVRRRGHPLRAPRGGHGLRVRQRDQGWRGAQGVCAGRAEGSGGDDGVGRAGGLPVVDMRCVLYDGSYHEVDSSVLAFQIAARQAFRDGVKKAAPRLLEPIMKVEVITPEESMGDVIGDLNSRRGMIQSMGDRAGSLKVVTASVPLAEMFNYVSKLRGMTKGRANYTMKLDRYEPVPPNIQEQIAKERSAAS